MAFLKNTVVRKQTLGQKKKGVQEAKQYLELVSTFDIFLPNESSDQ